MYAVLKSGALVPFFLILGTFALLIFNFLLIRRWLNSGKKTIAGKHVVITGGSSGIGKSLAIEAAAAGAHVTIISRNAANLEIATKEIIKSCKDRQSQKIQHIALDVTEDYESIRRALATAEENVGPVYMLVNSAGMAICGRLEDMSVEDVKHMINLNYFGTVYPTKAVLSGMKARCEGIIVFVSTQAALMGIYGYGAYGAAKWGVRGLGEALLMELIGTGVSLTIGFPPDTDTPGFEAEEASKPTETKIISETGGLYPPQVVARKLLDDALSGNAYSTVGFEGWMLITLCGTAWRGVFRLLEQVMLMSSIRIILSGFQLYFKSVIIRCKKEKNTKKKAE